MTLLHKISISSVPLPCWMKIACVRLQRLATNGNDHPWIQWSAPDLHLFADLGFLDADRNQRSLLETAFAGRIHLFASRARRRRARVLARADPLRFLKAHPLPGLAQLDWRAPAAGRRIRSEHAARRRCCG